MSFIYTLLTWIIAGTGFFALVCVIFIWRYSVSQSLQAAGAVSSQATVTLQTTGTNLSYILLLFGIAAVNGLLNGLMNIRFFPMLNLNSRWFFPYAVAVVLPILGFFAGKSIQVFIRRFLLPAIIFSILLPTLVVLESQPFFIQCMNTLVTLFNNLLWVFFTAAVVGSYSPAYERKYSGFFFYFFVISIHFALNIFPFLIVPLTRNIPAGNEYSIVIICVAAILSLLLSLKILIPGFNSKERGMSGTSASAAYVSSYEDVYRKHDLTKTEILITDMIVREGCSNEKIADKLFRSVITVKKHTSSIYAKFDVKNRAELVSAVIREKEKEQM